jgi:Ca2+-binding RTX toxin-like protein
MGHSTKGVDMKGLTAVIALLAVGTVILMGAAAASGSSTPTCFGEPATIVGAGTILGTPDDDVIIGSEGADVIDGSSGDDRICALDGVDRALGGPGDDLIDAGPGVTSPRAISEPLATLKPTAGVI